MDSPVLDGSLLRVKDKGKLPKGQHVHWVIPGEGISLISPQNRQPIDWCATVREARHLGEMSLVTMTLDQRKAVCLRLTLSGSQDLNLEIGSPVCVRLNCALVHVMPVHLRHLSIHANCNDHGHVFSCFGICVGFSTTHDHEYFAPNHA